MKLDIFIGIVIGFLLSQVIYVFWVFKLIEDKDDLIKKLQSDINRANALISVSVISKDK